MSDLIDVMPATVVSFERLGHELIELIALMLIQDDPYAFFRFDACCAAFHAQFCQSRVLWKDALKLLLGAGGLWNERALQECIMTYLTPSALYKGQLDGELWPLHVVVRWSPSPRFVLHLDTHTYPLHDPSACRTALVMHQQRIMQLSKGWVRKYSLAALYCSPPLIYSDGHEEQHLLGNYALEEVVCRSILFITKSDKDCYSGRNTLVSWTFERCPDGILASATRVADGEEVRRGRQLLTREQARRIDGAVVALTAGLLRERGSHSTAKRKVHFSKTTVSLEQHAQRKPPTTVTDLFVCDACPWSFDWAVATTLDGGQSSWRSMPRGGRMRDMPRDMKVRLVPVGHGDDEDEEESAA